MKLTFLGTRGNIAIRSRLHRLHASLMVSVHGSRVRIDCGADWLGRVDERHHAAILLTHTHPDHADGLKAGVRCPVYATPPMWQAMERWPLVDRRVLRGRRLIAIEGLEIEAWPVEHATNAPAVGYRVAGDGVRIFYVPDIARLPAPGRALSGVDLYIGDGAAVDRPILRRRGRALIGHTTVETQLAWCRRAGIARALFTHCGSGIVRAHRAMEMRIRAMGRAQGVEARIACDGLTTLVRPVRCLQRVM
jgi:phosphoribosyl 1,2-cyclic phosphodiesterase